MPLLHITTNQRVQDDHRETVLKKASAQVAEMLSKPESYVMVVLDDGTDMLFAGSDEPVAYLELKSLGLPEDDTSRLSLTLCNLMNELLGVPVERVYIEFAGPARHLWGWNQGTF